MVEGELPDQPHELEDLEASLGSEFLQEWQDTAEERSDTFTIRLIDALTTLQDDLLEIPGFKDAYYQSLVRLFRRHHSEALNEGQEAVTSLSALLPQTPFSLLSVNALRRLIGDLEAHGIVRRVDSAGPNPGPGRDPAWTYVADPDAILPYVRGSDRRLLPLLKEVLSDVSQSEPPPPH